ncbi:sugar ABC transporter substrate-binding protein [Chitinimonas sp.]|uniref:sugar ABC transporter substrate-binding protein n=1 Tax=Chitinimonas sp. TaxID=1934313 RepID=UPI002F91CE2C
MNRRRFLESALAGAVCLSPAWATGKKPVIALLLKSMRNEFFRVMADGARAHQARRKDDYELILQGVQEETDVKGQQALIEQLLAKRVDAIVIVPADSVTMLPILLKAISAGVLVINLDNKLDDRALASAQVNIPFVGPSNFNGARGVGDYMARLLPAGSKVGLIEGPPGSINAKARSDGYRDAMRRAGMEIAGIRSGYWEIERGEAAATELLEAEPTLKALLCGNDNMAIGAARAVEAKGRRGQVLIAGYDHIPAIKPLIAVGSVTATADQYPARQAEYALDLAIKALAAHTPQAELPGIVQTPVQLVTGQK